MFTRNINLFPNSHKLSQKKLFLKQLLIGDERWILYKTEWKRLLKNQNKPSQSIPKSKGDVLFIVGLEGRYEFLLESEAIDLSKYDSHLNQLKAAINE